jgi:phosphoribosylanthranilate isomerase
MIQVKICGVTTPADAAFSAAWGADAVGLNFYPKSPRFVDADRAASIVQQLPSFVSAVGVFVTEPTQGIRAVADALRLAAIQTYNVPYPEIDSSTVLQIAAYRVESPDTLAAITADVQARKELGRPLAAVLVDAFVPGEMGGTGHRAPWDLLAGFDPGVPVILAGGLTPDNVAEAIRTVRPAGVDVASGVESAPGIKDPGKVRAFIQAAREASAGLPDPPSVFRLRAGPRYLE